MYIYKNNNLSEKGSLKTSNDRDKEKIKKNYKHEWKRWHNFCHSNLCCTFGFY